MNADSPDDNRAPLGRGERTAVLVIDMLTDYDHPDGDALRASAASIVPVIAGLRDRAREQDVPVVWINDNHGEWAEDREGLIASARRGAGAALIDPIAPHEGAPFLFKARHSVFFGSPLEYLLELEGIGRLVLAGQVTEQCILYSALDAYIRHFQVVVPRDAVAHIDPDLAEASLRLMERNMRAQVVDAADVELRPEG